MAAYLIVLASLNYAVLYSTTDFNKYKLIVYANIFLLVLAMLVPFAHRYNDILGGVIVAFSEIVMLFYLISVLGRDSGIQMNYIIAAAVPFLIFDLSRIKLILTIALSALVFHIAAWFMFPADAVTLIAEPFLLANLYVNSALTAFCIVAVVAYYAMTLVRRAEAQTDALLKNILPESVADKLMIEPDRAIADSFKQATVLFADLVGFTPLSKGLGAEETVKLLNNIFTEFDHLALKYELEKIKTIGDAYMVAAGIPEPTDDHEAKMALFALDMLAKIKEISQSYDADINLRIGIQTGPVTAGVIGRRKFAYDVWGDTVNLASRMESHGVVGKIHVTADYKGRLDRSFKFEPRGVIQVKGIGEVETWFLTGTLD
ncbi:MAG: adenylate/guanylate cyclase domain-containing protein [Nitrospirota bacterium]|nr:MAG: adenylate/guanylate cyclase domain-containing protein [Nitrospirota bacterium]